MSRRLQIILLAFVALAGLRVFLIYRARNAPASAPDAKSEEVAPGVRVRAQQVMVVFHPAGEDKTYADPIGGSRGGDYTFYINETFFFVDPHQLYKHWPQDVWNAIDQHQVKPGMNELQVALAIGAGVPQGSGDFGNRTLRF